jgi:hypothetical protein
MLIIITLQPKNEWILLKAFIISLYLNKLKIKSTAKLGCGDAKCEGLL